MTESKQTNRHIILVALANVLVLCLCALVWGVIAEEPVCEEQIVATQAPFQLSLSEVSQYSWMTSSAGGMKGQDVCLVISDTADQIIYETHIAVTDELEDGRYVPLTVDNSFLLETGATYIARFYLADGSEYTGQSYIAFYGAETSLVIWFALICLCVLVITNLILLLVWKVQEHSDPKITILIAVILLLLGVLVNVIYLPLNVPDESDHFLATYYMSGQIMPDNSDSEYRISRIPVGVRQNMSALPAGQQIYSFWYDQAYGNDVSTQDAWGYNRGVNYANYGYWPAAIGMTIARALKLPYQMLLITGRMSNYIAWLLLVMLACKAASDLRMAILAIAGLPSTIWLTASYSYDGWNLGFSILFTAYLWRLATHKEQRIGLRQILVMVLLLLAFAPIKYIYVLLGLLVFAIPTNRWKNIKIIIGAIVIGGISGLIVLRSRLQEVLELLLTSKTDERGLTQGLSGEPFTVSTVLHHPLQITLTFIQTFYTDLEKMIERMLIGEFHSDCVPGYLSMMLGVLFILLMLITTRDTLAGRQRTGNGQWTVWMYRAVLVIGTLAIYGSFLFAYSYYNEGRIGVISGVQGRYFLPLILLLAPAGSARLAKWCSVWLERHGLRSMQAFGGLLYVSLLVLLCRMPGFIE